jgi:plasmid stabilization system protein ParE
MVEIIWTERALDQLERAVRYIKTERGVHYASIVLEKILSKTAVLANYPRCGQEEFLLKHKKSEYRYLMVFSYKIIYKVSNEKITISRVFHTAQNPRKLKGV